ncbi:hypothetical protein [Okeania sp. SIO1I7]|uniref:hypothetical protein n=1 Tax=Okeania sp. SIO1I7 TaxID=2607772 RepID=UPI0013F8EF20|nr:hypothetical protein [Okeania sp. SIO1I7]NET29508.1 hypothetical protein [Okeania sp. SIO1I7]
MGEAKRRELLGFSSGKQEKIFDSDFSELKLGSLTSFCPDTEKAFEKLLGITLADMDIRCVPDFYMIHYCNYRNKTIIGLSLLSLANNMGEIRWNHNSVLISAKLSLSKDLLEHNRLLLELQDYLFPIFSKHAMEQIDESIEEILSLQDSGDPPRSSHLISFYKAFRQIVGDS